MAKQTAKQAEQMSMALPGETAPDALAKAIESYRQARIGRKDKRAPRSVSEIVKLNREASAAVASGLWREDSLATDEIEATIARHEAIWRTRGDLGAYVIRATADLRRTIEEFEAKHGFIKPVNAAYLHVQLTNTALKAGRAFRADQKALPFSAMKATEATDGDEAGEAGTIEDFLSEQSAAPAALSAEAEVAMLLAAQEADRQAEADRTVLSFVRSEIEASATARKLGRATQAANLIDIGLAALAFDRETMLASVYSVGPEDGAVSAFGKTKASYTQARYALAACATEAIASAIEVFAGDFSETDRANVETNVAGLLWRANGKSGAPTLAGGASETGAAPVSFYSEETAKANLRRIKRAAWGAEDHSETGGTIGGPVRIKRAS